MGFRRGWGWCFVFEAVLLSPERVICWGWSCFGLSELYDGFSCLTLLATVRGGTEGVISFV
jgi:hypothetical protein